MSRVNFSNRLVILLVFLSSALISNAQSGRKAPQYPKYPTETTQQTGDEKTSAEKPESKPEADNKLKKTLLWVGSDVPEMIDMTYSNPKNMETWVIERLTQSRILDVGVLGGQTNRSQAIKRAKTETQTLTILLELERNFFENSVPGDSGQRSKSVWINYYIFEPGTGKAIHKGRVSSSDQPMFGTSILNKIGVTCYPAVRGNDLLLLRASIEVADRIMSDLSIPVPALCSSRF